MRHFGKYVHSWRGKCKSLRDYVLLSFTQLTSSSIVNAFLKLSRHKKVCSFSIELRCCVACLGLKKFQLPFQGNLDRHGNPSWFLSLQDESNFQTKISHKWLEILVSFFHVKKIWYLAVESKLLNPQKI